MVIKIDYKELEKQFPSNKERLKDRLIMRMKKLMVVE